MNSPYDPTPSIKIVNGEVVEMDGKTKDEFDMLDAFIAKYAINLDFAEEAMAKDSLEIARMLVDINVNRAECLKYTTAVTPAKLVEIVGNLNVLETMMGITKMRCRLKPANQCHVTNVKDNMIQIAADAAEAAVRGFAEMETTVGIVRYAPFNAIAIMLGANVGRTPWSKAFLASCYASRGVKMRFTSGTGSEVQMGMAEGKSMLYLEARCLGVTRGAGVQGTQNGSVSCIGVPAAVPGGIRAVACENLIAAMLDLENASSNDQTFTHSDLRRVARSIPQFIPGTDYICSGYSATPNYDNMFAGSNWDADDYDDWVVIQRDLKVDAGLVPATEDEVVAARNKAARAIQALFRELGLPEITDEEVEAATYARGSQDMPDRDVVADLKAATDMLDRGVTGIDFVKALYKGGFEDVAESIFNIQKAKVVGDYLHTASMLDNKFHVISAVNSPNCYEGPMTGYQISPELWTKLSNIRTAVDPSKI